MVRVLSRLRSLLLIQAEREREGGGRGGLAGSRRKRRGGADDAKDGVHNPVRCSRKR